MEKVKELLDESIKKIGEEGITTENIDTLKTLIDIKKDITEEEYNKEQKEALKMRYRSDFNEDYGARRRDSRGRYSHGRNDGYPRGMGRGNYGHNPEEYFEKMFDGYDEYINGMSEYNRSGNYGAKDKSVEALEYLWDNLVCLVEYMMESADSPEEMEINRKYIRKIKEV